MSSNNRSGSDKAKSQQKSVEMSKLSHNSLSVDELRSNDKSAVNQSADIADKIKTDAAESSVPEEAHVAVKLSLI